jgi:hypothetical protein
MRKGEEEARQNVRLLNRLTILGDHQREKIDNIRDQITADMWF